MKVGSAPTTPRISPKPTEQLKTSQQVFGPVPSGNASGDAKPKGSTVAKKRPGKERKRQSR